MCGIVSAHGGGNRLEEVIQPTGSHAELGAASQNLSPLRSCKHFRPPLPKLEGPEPSPLTSGGFHPGRASGTEWYHWVVFDIPPSVHELKEGAGAKGSPELPAGAVLGLTDFGFSQYGGPCPPAGDKPHHYNFTVYALAA